MTLVYNLFIGPPNPPINVAVNAIGTTSFSLSWTAGFDNGFNQTVVIQLSTNGQTWSNKTMIIGDSGSSNKKHTETLNNLDHSTLHYVRLFSYNREGNSNYSEVVNFTTHVEEGTYHLILETIQALDKYNMKINMYLVYLIVHT